MPKRPNLIWIFGDQHRAQALSCNGDVNAHTPNIDRLAVDGMSFTQAVAGCPLSCPYRGSLLSSQYPHNAVPGHEYPLPPQTKTIAHAFKDAGYHTAWFGKWHVDGWHERDGRGALHRILPERRGGFDQWLGYENNNAQWDCWVHGHDAAGKEIEHHRLPGFETDMLTGLFIEHLRQRVQRQEGQGDAAQPFFAALSVQPPHDPYVAPAPWMGKYNPAAIALRPNVPAIPRIVEQARRELAGYYAMIENLDHNLGRIVAALHELGITQDTHVLFFSDHGDMHGSQGQFRKTSPWEESIRVPFVMGGPSRYGTLTGRRTVPINHVDVAPTSLGLCGIDKPLWMAGYDYSGHRIHGRKRDNEPDSAFLQLVEPTRHGNSIDRAWRGVVTRDGWKYVCLEGQPWLMFNLSEDPYEQANLAHNTAFTAERKRLHDRLAQWISDTGDEFALPTLHAK
ncbi:MAG: sulfatase [Phycisphaeraceae bacterium]